ncbi:ABC transporter permease [Cohnella hashimotonis]|uniref:ABC-2 family transporter protein n=1 Tax=Cohnella hashimotonis TaxID=2826895 RepID=A0ABT6TLW8_9BACL|nr:ABC-2 family transporter protein [Cohnella hashimotonis]MDI4647258.1 ABC-2 family transporter protein [Cohnella hashimotonis]
MPDKLRYYASVGLFYLKLSLQKQLEYPMYYLSCFVMIPLMYGTGILLLRFIVSNFQPLSGWTFAELAFLYGLGQLSHGITMVFSVQNLWLETYVLRGEFDRMLLRPLGVFYQFTVKYINIIGLMDVAVGVAILIYGSRLAHFEWTVGHTIRIGLVVAGAALIRSSVFTIFCSVAFWTKRSQSMFMLLNDFMERSTLYPLSIYPYALQAVLTAALPIAFISFYPACAMLDKACRAPGLPDISLWTPIVGAVLFVLAHFVFNRGLRNYESAGA